MAGRPEQDAVLRQQGECLAARLRQLREARGWSREYLAGLSGVPVRTLVRLEAEGTAEPGFFTVAALATALDVSLDELARVARESVPGPGLVSVGYEGRSLERFVEALCEQQVATVADVRLTPVSRKPGFSKTRLSQALAEAGIEYRHLRGLGNPKENRPPFWEGRVEEGRRAFRRLLATEPAASQLQELIELAGRQRVAVLCFEQDESRCHRQVILEEARSTASLPVASLP
ncbi:hypothetical protein C3Y87_00070 [Carbonactinospora thermoautotrophica]|uniref:DUF488 family protein, N3 subclade n=1 Tax=Carbonactinospora thermoautotrophica TaxID=1469144 RepID=UPI00226F6CFC|nr:DUF488 family protein [Carbonactinospora thermoautotrophica]MCX9189840.1 hypothetical protein [Carbonactinospora thermoautotrophica]